MKSACVLIDIAHVFCEVLGGYWVEAGVAEQEVGTYLMGGAAPLVNSPCC